MLVPGQGLRLRYWMLRPLTTIISGTLIVGATQIMPPFGRLLLTIAFTQGFQYCMSNPSLLCVPYRYKAGVLYSQVPSSNLGDFTVTRSASNSATRVNAAGLIELVADNVPRLDYPLGGITAGCPALLVEPLAENICLQSADFNTTWATAAGATVNTNTAISPDGTQNADTINLSTTAATRVAQNVAIANSTTYTLSCFFKNIALTAGQTFRLTYNNQVLAPNNFEMTALIDLAAGTASYTVGGTAGTGFSGTATGRVENYGNGWYRISVTATTGTGAAANGQIQILQIPAGAARSFYAWGAQLEASSVPTSYIPTAASSVTRGAETISKTGVSSLIGQTEGTIYVEWENKDNGLSNLIETYNNASGVTGNSSILIQKISNNGLNIRVFDSSGNYSDNFTITMPIGKNKAALAYQLGSAVLYLNGSLVGSNSRTYTFGSSRDTVSFDPRGAYPRASAVLYPTRLPNTAPLGVLSLQSLTQ
jgi:hypothetical protein